MQSGALKFRAVRTVKTDRKAIAVELATDDQVAQVISIAQSLKGRWVSTLITPTRRAVTLKFYHKKHALRFVAKAQAEVRPS